MKYTYQAISTSGSFALPKPTDVDYADSIADLRRSLELWVDDGANVGVDSADQSLVVWIGTFDDVTDQYPNFELWLGPRGGLRRGIL